MGFSWLSDIFNALLKFIPRPVIIRATHGGVKWRFGKWVKELKPGWHWIWPLTTDYEIIVTARQTNHQPGQALTTKDKKQVVVSVLVVFSVKDIVKAIGEQNWDVGTTVNDISQAAVVDVITNWNLDDLMEKAATKVREELTEEVRKQLRMFGVYVHRVALTELSLCRVFKIIGKGETPTFSVEGI
ncbi:SPFH domain-containing protein [Candidatus Pacearchaeota archaeon]|jgi:regulator of protease activity HflC (stomatin/prohibitin superfamily)|nr:SPFH domain-containing protein [Candidatus Pacearchaeota archaeon]